MTEENNEYNPNDSNPYVNNMTNKDSNPTNQNPILPYSKGKNPMQKTLGRVFGETLIKATIWSTVISISIIVITFLSALALIFGLVVGINSTTDSTTAQKYVPYAGTTKENSNKILLLNINGVIVGEGESSGGIFSESSVDGYAIQDALVDAANDSEIDGVILKMDTPGGTIYGATAIAEGVNYYKKKSHNPIIAYVSSMSASGGVMAMVGADKIYADHGTLVGSIGVIFGPFTYYNNPISEGSFLGNVETKDGIEKEYITAGKGKDVGNSFRRITPEERGIFQDMVNNSYDEFVERVSRDRDIPQDKIKNEFGARLFDEISAKKAGLIDGVKSRNEVYAKIASMAEINIKNMQIVTLSQPEGSVLDGLLGKVGVTNKSKVKTSKTCLSQTTLLSYYGDMSEIICK